MPESEVLAGDYALGDELVIPAGGGAAAARRRAAFEPLRFLSLASAGLLEKPSDSLPWAAMAELQGRLTGDRIALARSSNGAFDFFPHLRQINDAIQLARCLPIGQIKKEQVKGASFQDTPRRAFDVLLSS